MKIAIITSGFLPVIDGVTVSGLYRLQKLSDGGHEVLLFCPDYSSLEKIYPNWQDYTGNILPGVRVINLASTSFMDLDFERNVSFRSYQKLLQELEEFQPDIIHVDEPERLFVGFLRVPGVKFARSHKIPCVGFFRTNFLEYAEDYFSLPSFMVEMIKWLFKQMLKYVYNSYDVTLVASKITHEKVKYLGINNTFCDNLLGVDLDKFNPNLRQADFFQHQYNINDIEDKVKIVFLGRLTPDKGWDFTMEAWKKVVETIDMTKVALIIAGDGPIREEILTELSQYTKHIHLLGRIPPDEIPALLANSDFHLTTSCKETKGLTIIEAFAAGIPVIAPRAGGVVEHIQDGWNGFLFTPQDQDDFCSKIKILVENSEQREKMGHNARESIKEYSWDRTVENLVKIWQDQINLRKKMIIN